MDRALSGPGLLSGRRFIELVQRRLPARDFAELELTLGVVATNITDMEEVHFFEGPLLPALRASIALPFVVAPVEKDGDQPFLAGERPTIADCTLFAAFGFARFGEVEIDPAYRNLARWSSGFGQRPSANL